MEQQELRLNPSLAAVLLEWYGQNARELPWRRDREPYRVWLSEIMLQQTRVEVVKGYYLRFLEVFPTVQSLAEGEEERLLKLWEGLGYYSRARNLQKAAKAVMEQYGGEFPTTYQELLKLPGVGPYTAGAIASICFERPTPAVDGNVLRIVARMAAIAEPVDTPAMKARISEALLACYPENRRGDFTQSLMELGATICLPGGTPKCALCPTAGFCAAFAQGNALDYPVKQEKKQQKIQHITAFVLQRGDSLAIRQRPRRGLLAGLWELPNVPGELTEQQALEHAAEWGAQPKLLTKSLRRTHVFTHIKWLITCYFIACDARPKGFTWANAEELEQIYTLPTAFKMLLD